MYKKQFFTTFVLLFGTLVQLCGSSFTFSASDILTLKIKSDKSVTLKLSSSSFQLDSKRFVAKTAYGSFYLYLRGGGGAYFDLGQMKLGFDYSVKKPEDPTEKAWYYTERDVSDRHMLFSALVRSSWFMGEAGLDLKVHYDNSFGLYADTRSFAEFSKNGIRIYVERSFSNSQKTEGALDFGNIFGAKIKINKGAAPVFGQTSRKVQTDFEIWFKAGSLTAKALNVCKIKEDTGTDYYTDLSLKFESSVLDMSASTRLLRTSGSAYGFDKMNLKMAIRITQDTDFGKLSLQFNEDRSIKIGLQSEVSHAGAGKFRFTGDIDP